MLFIKNGKFDKAGEALSKHFSKSMDSKVSLLIKTQFSLNYIKISVI